MTNILFVSESWSVDREKSDVVPASDEMLTLRVRYKEPDADISKRMDVPLTDRGTAFGRATGDFRFAAAVADAAAEFGAEAEPSAAADPAPKAEPGR